MKTNEIDAGVEQKEDELISIIVPAYNVEYYIEKCMHSLCQQSYSNIEIVVVDDGSTDSTGKKLDDMSAEDERIKVIHQENSGVSKARNKGIEEANGHYLAFVDSDDCVDVDYIKALYDALGDNDLAVSGYKNVRGGKCVGGVIPHSLRSGMNIGEYLESIYEEHLGMLQIGTLCGKLYSAECVKKNNIKLPTDTYYAEDHIFNATYLAYARSVAVVNTAHYNYNVDTEGSLTKNRSQKLDYYWSSFETAHRKLMQALEKQSLQKDYDEALAYYFSMIFMSTCFIGVGRNKEEVGEWMKSVKGNAQYMRWLSEIKTPNAGVRSDVLYKVGKLGVKFNCPSLAYDLFKLMYKF